MGQHAELSLQIPQRKQGLEVREIDGETVILDTENERMHNLSSTAAFIFGSIDGAHTIEQIWRDLAEGFEVSLEIAERDTRAFITQLRDLRLID